MKVKCKTWREIRNSQQKAKSHRCENDEGEKKKPLLRNDIFWEFLKKKDMANTYLIQEEKRLMIHLGRDSCPVRSYRASAGINSWIK
ncbi:hypothetical protein RND71_025215 [Anisodus tanguticus]|uniref:Uncharacterized protein n=1 Tax=Anisodus tanguticus TaxID=243964 RepID=A0AAE1VCH1_9SOLA|nr:hypothetical protein RND71_025215 [Anisodus tanguticus]